MSNVKKQLVNKVNQLRESEILAQGFLDHLTNSEKMHLLNEIIEILQGELKSAHSQIKVHSAVRLSEKEKEMVCENFLGEVRQSGDIKFEVDPKLLGGIKIFQGDNVIDLSAQGKLETLVSKI